MKEWEGEEQKGMDGGKGSRKEEEGRIEGGSL